MGDLTQKHVENLWSDIEYALRQTKRWCNIRPIRVLWSREADKSNAIDPRAFAYQTGFRICVSKAMLELDLDLICGVMLHEWGHVSVHAHRLHQQAIPPEINEALADVEVLRYAPECDYRYQPKVDYELNGVERTAKFLQCADPCVFLR